MANAMRLPMWDIFPYYGGSIGFNNFTLNQSTDQHEVIFAAAVNEPITRLLVRLGTITGSSPTYKISLQGVDGSGNPDGTIKGGGSPASKTFNPTSLGWTAGAVNVLALDNSYTPSFAERLAIVVAYDSGTINTSNCASFTNWITTAGQAWSFPYSIQNDNGTRSKQSNLPIYGYGTASSIYGNPIQTINSHLFSSASNPNEYAMKFTLPAGWGDTFQTRLFQHLFNVAVNGTISVKLYDGGGASDTTVIQSVSFDSDQLSGTPQRLGESVFDTTTLATLNMGGTYRLSFGPTTATNMTVYSMDVANVADWDAFPGEQNVCLSTRNGGNWTDVLTRKLYGCKPVLSDLTKPAGGGGNVVVVGPYSPAPVMAY